MPSGGGSPFPGLDYSASSGLYRQRQPDGSFKYLTPDEVPTGARHLAEAQYPPSAPNLTWEQRYQAKREQVPAGARWATPRTLGEATGSAVGIPSALAAPESFGATAVAPVLAAAAGGYMEPQTGPFPLTFGYAPGWRKGGQIPWPTRERIVDALEEGGKEAFALAGGKLLFGKIPEWTARGLGKERMLGDTATRIGTGVYRMFNKYPLPLPQTGEELTTQIGNGQLKKLAGEEVGNVRDDIVRALGEYKPGRERVRAHGLEEIETYVRGKRPKGISFNMPFVRQNPETGVIDIFYQPLGAKEAIDHVVQLRAQAYSAVGEATSGEKAPFYREAGHLGNDIIIKGLKDAGFDQLADDFAKANADYGAAVTLTNLFQKARRPDGFLDQWKIRDALEKEMEDLHRVYKDGRAELFRQAVEPAGRAVIPESEWGGHAAGGLSRMHSWFTPPRPLYPEDPQMIAATARFLNSPRGAGLRAYPLTLSSQFWGPWLAQRTAKHMEGEEGGGEQGGME